VSAIKVLNHNALIANGGYWQMKNILRIFLRLFGGFKVVCQIVCQKKTFYYLCPVFPGTTFVCREGVFEIKGVY